MVVETDPLAPRVVRPVDDKRRETYLQVLRETGSHSAAARRASPWAGKRGAVSTFKDLRHRDPIFEAQCQRALSDALGKFEQLAMRLAEEGDRRPIFDKNGALLGHETRHDSRLILAVLAKLNPGEWSQRSQVEHSGRIVTANLNLNLGLELTPEDILSLPENLQEVFTEILQVVVRNRKTADGPTPVSE